MIFINKSIKMVRKLLKENLITSHRLNRVLEGYCGTHNIKQYMFENDETFDPFGHIDSSDVITEPIDADKDCILTFNQGEGNSKLEWPYFSLPAGFTCPFATVCKTFAAEPGGKKFSDGSSLLQGKEAEFRCYAARAQAQYPNAYKNAHRNLDLLIAAGKKNGVEGMKDLLIKSIKYNGLENEKVIRVHESGDFFTNSYFKAWMETAREFPNILFYAYTTSIQFWLANKASIPNNFKLIASMDKKNAQKIIDNNLRYSVVVYTPEEAKELGLKIDVDDTLAWGTDDNFALLLHGGQPAGSEAAKAIKQNKKTGTYDKIKQLYKANQKQKKEKLKNL
jgi:hypothetical protein